ncbi:hypothetical protein DPMN_145662 [Dreissena polymorpha]|uniref:Uncharacterized protein n=1 Tax=Dreissena polymorpha TaxID=45954 RepID=A0A9D4IXQ9_DREPO|nr:hypothetical protein DPMN_145662 [Dreissena polymorpha]
MRSTPVWTLWQITRKRQGGEEEDEIGHRGLFLEPFIQIDREMTTLNSLTKTNEPNASV